MQTELIAPTAGDNKAAYIANREAWREIARNKENTAATYVQYIITQSVLLIDKLGEAEAQAWAIRKLKAAFTPSKSNGRRALISLLRSARYWSPFNQQAPFDRTPEIRAMAQFLHDEFRLED